MGDAGDGELHAIELTGDERWTYRTHEDAGLVYWAPILVDGVAYVISIGRIHAVDAADGERLWVRESATRAPRIVAVEDAVYVADGEFVVLDRDDGDVLWRYGDPSEDEWDLGPAVNIDTDSDVAYLSFEDTLAAVSLADEIELWETEPDTHDGIDRLYGPTGGRLLATDDGTLRAFAVCDGTAVWTEDGVPEEYDLVAHDGVVYLAAEDQLAALAAADGEELWRTAVDAESPIQELTLAESPRTDAADETLRQLYARTDDRIRQVGLDGDVTWTETFDAEIHGYHVDRYLFVGTEDGIYRFDPVDSDTDE